MKKQNQKGWLLFLALVGCLSISETTKAENRKPNIIYIFTDDIGIGKVPCYNLGPKLISMPNLDKLAQEGVLFTNAYANPVCGPSRASLLSGLHSGHCGIRYNPSSSKELHNAAWPPKKGRTLGEVAQKSGYKTAMLGKLGAGNNPTKEEVQSQGWDYTMGWHIHPNSHHFFSPTIWENGELISIPENDKTVQSYFKDGTKARVYGNAKAVYTENLMTDKILEFMNTHKENPMFIVFASQAGHGGRPGISVPTLGEYEAADLTFDEKVYASMITHHDKSIGRIMAELKKLNLDDNTIVIWTTDNGDENSYYKFTDTFKGPAHFRDKKRSLHEGGIRVPCIARWPNHITPKSKSDLQWAVWDLLPTIAEAGGLAHPEWVDGISIFPTLKGESVKQKKRKYLYWEFYSRPFSKHKSQQAVRMGNWKLYRYDGYNNAPELYNLQEDPSENKNLAEAYPEVVQKLNAIMEKEHTTHPHRLIQIPGFDSVLKK